MVCEGDSKETKREPKEFNHNKKQHQQKNKVNQPKEKKQTKTLQKTTKTCKSSYPQHPETDDLPKSKKISTQGLATLKEARIEVFAERNNDFSRRRGVMFLS